MPITRIRPRSPPCSRLATSPARTVWASRVTTNSRGGSPGMSGSSRAMRTRWRTRSPPLRGDSASDTPSRGSVHDDDAAEGARRSSCARSCSALAAWSACCGQIIVGDLSFVELQHVGQLRREHVGPRREVLTTSHEPGVDGRPPLARPAVASRWSAVARSACGHAVPPRRHRCPDAGQSPTSRTAPCSSSTSMSASTAAALALVNRT